MKIFNSFNEMFAYNTRRSARLFPTTKNDNEANSAENEKKKKPHEGWANYDRDEYERWSGEDMDALIDGDVYEDRTFTRYSIDGNGVVEEETVTRELDDDDEWDEYSDLRTDDYRKYTLELEDIMGYPRGAKGDKEFLEYCDAAVLGKYLDLSKYGITPDKIETQHNLTDYEESLYTNDMYKEVSPYLGEFVGKKAENETDVFGHSMVETDENGYKWYKTRGNRILREYFPGKHYYEYDVFKEMDDSTAKAICDDVLKLDEKAQKEILRDIIYHWREKNELSDHLFP